MISRTYEESQRFSREQLLGKRLRDLYPPEIAGPCDRDDLRTLETGEPIARERVMRVPDGTDNTFLIGRSPLRNRDREIYGMCMTATDISARIQTERDLRQARLLFEQALDHAPIGPR